MAAYKRTTVVLQNSSALLSIDLHGGAITNFHLLNHPVNPLSFAFSADQMPVNNKSGAPYRGHFLCLGRWGEPSEGEKKGGIMDHGHFANMWWEGKDSTSKFLDMEARSIHEGLSIERSIYLDHKAPVFMCREKVTNINPLGRLYNMVQHPTIAAPFLDSSTIISCNAGMGYPIEKFAEAEKFSRPWLGDNNRNKEVSDLSLSSAGESGVYSFIVRTEDDWGWITAVTPGLKLCIGYLWRRNTYPWINIWRHFVDGKIKYRGLEFGTSGMHQPFPVILQHAKNGLFGESVFDYIDAGEIQLKEYYGFLLTIPEACHSISNIYFDGHVNVNFDDGSTDIIKCNFPHPIN